MRAIRDERTAKRNKKINIEQANHLDRCLLGVHGNLAPVAELLNF